jgi:hypothetical protein
MSYRKYCKKSEQRFTSKQHQNTQNRRDSNQVKDQKLEQDINHLQVAVLKAQLPKALVKREWLIQKITKSNKMIDVDLAVKSNG